MTSLIDVIFLLLLFFMLTSTFSKYAEVELLSAGSGSIGPTNQPPIFMRLTQDNVSINGTQHGFDNLLETLKIGTDDVEKQTVLVSVGRTVTSQRLVDLLALLGRADGIIVQVLGGQ
jgi:biopolymer transport protein ExbD